MVLLEIAFILLVIHRLKRYSKLYSVINTTTGKHCLTAVNVNGHTAEFHSQIQTFISVFKVYETFCVLWFSYR